MQVRLDRSAERESLRRPCCKAGRAGRAGGVRRAGRRQVGSDRAHRPASSATPGTPVTVLSLRDLPATTLELEALLGAPLTDVLAGTATGEARLLVVDGAEAALEGRGQLLAETVHRPRCAPGWEWRRSPGPTGPGPCGAGAGRARPPRRALQARSASHEVPRLTAAEVSEVTAAFASMRRLAGDPRSAWLLGRPGLVDLLLRAGAAADLPDGPLSEADVFAAVWHHLVRRGEVTDPGGPTPDAREQAMLSLARRALLPASPADPPNPAALPSLRSDGLVISSGPAPARGCPRTSSPATSSATSRSRGC